jgi:hypothetical protein
MTERDEGVEPADFKATWAGHCRKAGAARYRRIGLMAGIALPGAGVLGTVLARPRIR